MNIFSYTIHHRDDKSSARVGTFVTSHGEIQTPVFMPVGTKGAVRTLSMEDLEDMGADIILGNTYHLYLRPGHDFLEKERGLHRFNTWNKSILTDSGGFQVFSLGAAKTKKGEGTSLVKIKEEGVEFSSYLDGSKHFFSPESVMEIQGSIGGDIIMAFDECAPHDASYSYLKQSVDRTHRWLDRCLAHFEFVQKRREEDWGEAYYPQALFPIVQGGVDRDLRTYSAEFIASKPTHGVAIGGLSVGESKEQMYEMIEVVDPILPQDKPRYLMGVGTPEDLLEGVARGIDMFDCVLPTRLGRHGAFFTHEGKCTITNAMFKDDALPLDPELVHPFLHRYSRKYLRHLFLEKEMLALRVLSFHNTYFLINLMKEAREHIAGGDFGSWKEEYLRRLKIKN